MTTKTDQKQSVEEIRKIPEDIRKIAAEMFPQVSRTYSQWDVERFAIKICNYYLANITQHNLKIRERVSEYFGHILNDGSGKPMNISLEEVGRDIIKLLDDGEI